MFYLLYTDLDNKQMWELVAGEDAMQIRVHELCVKLKVDADEIVVFNAMHEYK